MTKSYSDFIKEKIWFTKDMKQLFIPDMRSTHIISCLRMCEAKKWRVAFISIFLEELEARGFKETNPEYFV